MASRGESSEVSYQWGCRKETISSFFVFKGQSPCRGLHVVTGQLCGVGSLFLLSCASLPPPPDWANSGWLEKFSFAFFFFVPFFWVDNYKSKDNVITFLEVAIIDTRALLSECRAQWILKGQSNSNKAKTLSPSAMVCDNLSADVVCNGRETMEINTENS